MQYLSARKPECYCQGENRHEYKIEDKAALALLTFLLLFAGFTQGIERGAVQ